MKPEATLEELQSWADKIMERPADFFVGDGYLERWFVIPRNPFCNVYLHRLSGSDYDGALHDHPWDNTSLIIRGRYLEITGGDEKYRYPGDIIERLATEPHRLEMTEPEPCISLFMTGPVIRDWGFHAPQGWTHWREFTTLLNNHSVKA